MSKPFSDTTIYPVLFMLLITVFFVGVLSVFYRSSMDKIAANQQSEYEQLIVELLSETLSDSTGIDQYVLERNRKQTYNKYVQELPGYTRRAFQAVVNGKAIAYLFDIKGKGLWGSMSALLATDTSFKQILNFAVYDQMETPGLGSRITESFFKNQFKGKNAIVDGKPMIHNLVPEGQADLATNQIRQVTGATITSNSVLKMLNEELSILYSEFQQEGEND